MPKSGEERPEQRSVKYNIGHAELKTIVAGLNAKPFEQNLTLPTLDELPKFDLLELLIRVFSHLSPKFSVNMRDRPEEGAEKIIEMLEILAYPSSFDDQFVKSLINAEKRVIYPIFYYILTDLQNLEKRAYLSNYLVPIKVPAEFLVDDELKKVNQEYRDLQAEFQVTHEQLEAGKKKSMAPAELKKEIQTLNSERENLNDKIQSFKKKTANASGFQELLEATSMLRREQEEEAKIYDNLRTQKAKLDMAEQVLLQKQQRLIEARNALGENASADQMLNALRNEVRKNREYCNERIKLELNEKRRRIQQIEDIIATPPIGQNEVSSLEARVINLRKLIADVEQKIARAVASSKDSQLASYRQQVALSAKKKEKAMEEVRKMEEEKDMLAEEKARKMAEFAKLKGANFRDGAGGNNFQKHANDLKEKKQKAQQMKEELDELRAEMMTLSQTETKIKRQKEETDAELKEMEKTLGVQGIADLGGRIDALGDASQQINEEKGKTLEELSQLVIQLNTIVHEKKTVLKPIVDEYKMYKSKFIEVDENYKKKKTEFERALGPVKSEFDAVEAEYKQVRDVVYGDDTKLHLLRYQNQFLDSQIKKYNEEADFQRGKYILTTANKSYKDWFQNTVKFQMRKLGSKGNDGRSRSLSKKGK